MRYANNETRYRITKNISSDEIEVLYELSNNAMVDDDFEVAHIARHCDIPEENAKKAIDSLVAKGMLEVKE